MMVMIKSIQKYLIHVMWYQLKLNLYRLQIMYNNYVLPTVCKPSTSCIKDTNTSTSHEDDYSYIVVQLM